MNVLIVARTRMSADRRCLGGLTDDNRSVRLLTDSGDNWDTACPLRIGQIWDIDFTPVPGVVPPHTEDVRCHGGRFLGRQPDLRSHLLTRIVPWRGSIRQVLGGVLRYTSSGSAYLSRRTGLPDHSTGYWTADAPLILNDDNKHYTYRDDNTAASLAYVGEPEPLPTVQAGELIRVSVARWWRPEDAGPELEERCYLQLSGWYDHDQ
jgi:hypothetical protein